MTHAALPALASPLSFVVAETALAAYQMACATGSPDAYQAAAHALAGALRCERARRMAPRTPSGVRPRLVVDNDPPATAPRLEAKPAKPARKAAEDMDLRHPPVRRGNPAGSFLVEWTDGSTTRVQGVAWPRAKAASRWARAYQAANRVRRVRHARDLQSAMGGAAAIPARYARGIGGVTIDAPEWLELVACAPLPALVAVVDETTGERFEAPDGSAYGAGDPDAAARLAGGLCLPLLPWVHAEVSRDFRTCAMGSDDGLTAYYIKDSRFPVEACPGIGHAAPWPPAVRQAAINDARAAFALPVEIFAEPDPVAGDPVTATTADAIEGATVMVTTASLERAAGAVKTAEAAVQAERVAKGNAATSAAFLDASAALRAAKSRLDVLGDIVGKSWTATRGPGGVVKLTRADRGAVLSPSALPFLNRVQVQA